MNLNWKDITNFVAFIHKINHDNLEEFPLLNNEIACKTLDAANLKTYFQLINSKKLEKRRIYHEKVHNLNRCEFKMRTVFINETIDSQLDKQKKVTIYFNC